MITPLIAQVLRAYIDNLYVGDDILKIESGLGTKSVSSPKVGYQLVAGAFGE